MLDALNQDLKRGDIVILGVNKTIDDFSTRIAVILREVLSEKKLSVASIPLWRLAKNSSVRSREEAIVMKIDPRLVVKADLTKTTESQQLIISSLKRTFKVI